MRIARLTILFVVVALLVSVLPARAQDTNPAVTDLGQNVYQVDGTTAEIPNLLPAEDVAKIATLQQGRTNLFFISPISPDDQAILVTDFQNFGFLNIQDGSIIPFSPIASLETFFPLAPFFWFDGRTLGQAGIQVIDADNDVVQPAFLLVDRITGESTFLPLPNLSPDLLPVSVAPGGSKVLLIQFTLPEDGSVPGLLNIPLPSTPSQEQPAQPMPTWRQQQIDALAQRMPSLRARGELASAFDPAPFAVQFILSDTTLLVYDVATTATRDLLTLPAGARVTGLDWSNDGAKLALARTSLLDFPPVGAPRSFLDGALLSEQVYRDSTGNLPPAENPQFQNNVLETFELNQGTTQSLPATNGDGTLFADVSWSTDGQTLLVEHHHPGRIAGRTHPIYFFQFIERASYRFYNTALQEIGRIAPVELSAAQTTTASFVSPDEVIFSANFGTNLHPYYYNRVSGEFRNMADRAGTYQFITPTNLSQQLVFAFSSFTDPGDVYRVNWDGTGLTRLTTFNEELRLFSQTQQYPVSFPLANGQVREGVLILPADAPFPPQDLPIVVWQEGGPTAPVLNTWVAAVESPFALLPNFGYGVLVVPLYGRFGIGPERFNALATGNNFGQIDIDEQAEIVRQMIANGWTSSGKVGIAGCSYGGYFVHQSIQRHPDLYSAGHAMCSLVDIIVEWNRGFPFLAQWLEGLPPWVHAAEYQRDSPSYNAELVRTPLLSFHGTNDFLPITLAENIHLRIVNNGVPAKMLRFVGAGHGFGSNPNAPTPPELQPVYELYGAQEQILWFRTYLR